MPSILTQKSTVNRVVNDVSGALEPLGFIGWTLAADRYDNYPHSFAGTWDDLVGFVNKYRAKTKGVFGLSGLFANDGCRCLENALPRAWLPFDLDGDGGVSDDVLKRALDQFSGLCYVWYETASSKPQARKARILVKTTRPVTDHQSRIIGQQVASWTGIAGFDKSVYLLSQVAYLPPIETAVFSEHGQALDVDRILEKIPKPKPKTAIIKPLTAAPDARRFFSGNGLVKRAVSEGLHVVCPWADNHTKGDTTGTFYFDPSVSNGYAGGFKCHHAHCDGRSIADVFALMGARL